MKKLGSYVLSTPYQKRVNDMSKEAGGGVESGIDAAIVRAIK